MCSQFALNIRVHGLYNCPMYMRLSSTSGNVKHNQIGQIRFIGYSLKYEKFIKFSVLYSLTYAGH